MQGTDDKEGISRQIREFVAQNLLFSDGPFAYGDEASFLNEGIIDSMGILELVTFVEKTFGISVQDQEIVPDNFDSVRRLSSYITSKLDGQA